MLEDIQTPKRGFFALSGARRAAGFVLFAALMLATVGGTAAAPLLKATTDRAVAERTAAAGAYSGYGIAATFDNLDAAKLDSTMAAIKATGSTWLRYDLNWSAVASHPGKYDWSAPDRVTAAAHKYGLKVVMSVDLTPSYARPANCRQNERCAPSDVNAYVAFTGLAVARYKDQGVHVWEVWNEPNIAYRFGPAADVVKYVAMLKGSYEIIKQTDPTAFVIAASTAPAASKNGDLSPIDFLKAMYASGAAGYFDAISAHPYTYPITPSQSSPADAWGQLLLMHNEMASHGDGSKQIWITEFGAPTDGPQKPDEYVSEAVQAQIVTEAASLFKQFSWGGPFMWYEFQDSGTSKATSENFYGLIRANGTHKPSYDAFVQAVASSN